MNLRFGEVKRMNKKQNGKPKLSKDTLKTAKRLLKYVTETYKMRFILVFVCILISSVATISVSLSLKFFAGRFYYSADRPAESGFCRALPGACRSGLYLSSGSGFHLYLHQNDGLYRTGCSEKR